MPVSSRSESVKAKNLEEGNFIDFDHAAAGHDGVRCSISGSLFAKPCKKQEIDFYESSPLHPEIAKYMPVFFGTLSAAPGGSTGLDDPSASAATTIQNLTAGQTPVIAANTASDTLTPTPHESNQSPGQAQPQQESVAQDQVWVPSGGRKLDTDLSIALENVAWGFKRPNVIDIKLGSRLWADDAVQDKRDRLDIVSNETTSGSLGFRVAGMKVWVGEEEAKKQAERARSAEPVPTDKPGASKIEVIEVDGYKRYDKWYGRSFQEHNVKDAFQTFLAGAKAGRTDHSKLVASRLASDLRSLQAALEGEESRMYSSSVLYIYEGDSEAFDLALEEESKQESEKEKDATAPSAPGETAEESIKIQTLGEGELDLEEESELELGAEAATLEDLEEEEEPHPKVDDIRLIDFAHASWTPGQGPDENVLKGVRSLVCIVNELSESNP